MKACSYAFQSHVLSFGFSHLTALIPFAVQTPHGTGTMVYFICSCALIPHGPCFLLHAHNNKTPFTNGPAVFHVLPTNTEGTPRPVPHPQPAPAQATPAHPPLPQPSWQPPPWPEQGTWVYFQLDATGSRVIQP